MAKKHKIAYCSCGAVYGGEEHYYKTMYCKQCGKWLYWDRHSRIEQEDTQFEMDINIARERREGYL